MTETNKRWFVLIGILNKVLSNNEVEELYRSGKIKIYGPYADEQIKDFFNSKKLIRENIINRVGDPLWKPLHSYEDIFIRSLLTNDIFVEKKPINNEEQLVMVIQSIENPKRKVILWFVFVLFLFTTAYYYYDNYYCNPRKLYKRLKKNVVVIYSVINNDIKGLGTGFFLKGSKLILTNLHVISKATDINIKAGDGKTYTPESVNFVDPVNDLALIQVSENYTPEGLSLGSSDDIEEGDKIFVIGNPAGWELTLSEGIVSGKRNVDPITNANRETVQITAPISPGSSGSPVFNKRGKVIGVASIGSTGELQNLNFAASIKPVANYLDYVNKGYFKFLDINSNWVYIDSVNASSISSQNYYFTQKDYISSRFFYAPETLVNFSEDKKTVWLRIDSDITNRIESNFFYNDYKDFYKTYYSYLLCEIDCKNKKYLIRIELDYLFQKLQSMEDNFSNENWKTFSENSIIYRFCN